MNLAEVLEKIAIDIKGLYDSRQGLLVAVDGVDGSGKSMFAANLTAHLQKSDIQVLHVSVDGFHRPRAERYARGRYSPEGFFRDSYNYDKFKNVLLVALQKEGDRNIQRTIHDIKTDEQLSPEPIFVEPGTVVVVDGIFLHRDELFDYWDYSIFLDVDFQQAFHRMAKRDNGLPDPFNELNTRYREGQLLYFRECDPKSRATVIIDNNDFEHPRFVI